MALFKRNRERIVVHSEQDSTNQSNPTVKLSKALQENLNTLSDLLDKPDDLKMRQLILGNTLCAFVYIDGLIEAVSFQQGVVNNLETAQDLPQEPQDLFDHIYTKLIANNDVKKASTLDDIITPIFSGQTIIYIDGIAEALTINTAGGMYRQIDEPITETLIRGPREGFVENIGTNLAMIRRNLKDKSLRFKTYNIGRRSHTTVVLAYIEDITHPSIVGEIKKRLESIDMDHIPESGYIEEWIEDSFLTPFPQMMNTERPDKVISMLLEGKAAIIINGTPFALVMPIVFANVLQSPDDYYQRWTIGSLLRILRYLGAFLSVFLPALYIALVTAHPGMIPTKLALSIADSREGVPFPPVVEAVLMIVTFEILQEAGARLPQTIGQTIGIVGGLVIGEAAVQAGIVSPIMVIVVALTAIATFSIPSYSVAISFRIIRFGFMIVAAMFGLFGIVLAYIMVNIHFVNLKSFGVPYSTPFAPFFKRDWHDVVIRQPLQTISHRPKMMQTKDSTSGDPSGGK